MHTIIREPVSFSRRQKRLLHKQTLSMEGPGSILHDFEALLTYVEERHTHVTGMHQLPRASLSQINARLARPLQLGLQRPVQKSYPPIHGLYLLLRASGLTYLDYTGSQTLLMIDEEMHNRWVRLNPTERYCTLLETWLLRAWPEILGERNPMDFPRPNAIEEWSGFYPLLPDKGVRPLEESDELCLMYSPQWHNLGLLYLFGLIAICSAPPVEGEGWRIERIRRTPFGEALLALLVNEFFTRRACIQALQEAERASVSMLQPTLQPYFPAWRRTLSQPEEKGFGAGRYVFKVALWRGLWRRIASPGNASLDALAAAILDGFDFAHDHLYRFSYETRYGTKRDIDHPDWLIDGGPRTSEVSVGSLPLRLGQTMTFQFDFGDRWEFEVTLEQVDDPDKELRQCELLESQGKAPPQYRYSDEI